MYNYTYSAVLNKMATYCMQYLRKVFQKPDFSRHKSLEPFFKVLGKPFYFDPN